MRCIHKRITLYSNLISVCGSSANCELTLGSLCSHPPVTSVTFRLWRTMKDIVTEGVGFFVLFCFC